MEYLFVSYKNIKYKNDRTVLVDGEVLGKANQTLLLERGHHSVTLDGPQDYQPPRWEGVIENTNPLEPFQLAFK